MKKVIQLSKQGGGTMSVNLIAGPLRQEVPLWRRFEVVQRYRPLLPWMSVAAGWMIVIIFFTSFALRVQTQVRVLQWQYDQIHNRRVHLEEQRLPALQQQVATLYSTERLQELVSRCGLLWVDERGVKIVWPHELAAQYESPFEGGTGGSSAWAGWRALLTNRSVDAFTVRP